ncbi:MAG: rRNA cytosine-C5-methyltransferase, partial [Prevotellaceae bacterium]|nr:rRNA cytosine-C5-methyltransferase [Prevotellaceae bacterium]
FILQENLFKWGMPDVVVAQSDPSDYGRLSGVFDLIVADVPCSGEGMFRKDPTAVAQWSEANVEMCSRRQRRIIADVWPSLREGGYLIYSTCTFNCRENEENIAWILSELGGEVVALPVPEAWNVTGNLNGSDFPVYRFLPHRTRGEGFFMAVIRKTDATPRRYADGKGKRTKNNPSADFPSEWLIDADSFRSLLRGTTVYAVRAAYYAQVQQWCAHLNILSPGTEIGERKGKDFVPAPALALTTMLRQENFPTVKMNYEAAINYLRREIFSPDTQIIPRGYALVAYDGLPLGFIKHLGNRTNNLYPSEWRIRSTLSVRK